MRKSRPIPIAVDDASCSDDAGGASENDEVLAVPAKRKRGRPANPGGPQKPVVKKPLVARGRGRPIKAKGRGRPPKAKVVQAESEEEDEGLKDDGAKKAEAPAKRTPSKGQARKEKA